MDNLDDFLRWCAQFTGFPYSQVGYWVDAYRRGDGKDIHGHRMRLLSGQDALKTRNPHG